MEVVPMRTRNHIAILSGVLVLVCTASAGIAQRQTTTPYAQEQARKLDDAQDHRPPLFFRETWKPPTAAKGTSCAECNQTTQKLVAPEFLDNPNLEVKLSGPGAKQLIVTQRTAPKDDPTFIWSGLATANWLAPLRPTTKKS